MRYINSLLLTYLLTYSQRSRIGRPRSERRHSRPLGIKSGGRASARCVNMGWRKCEEETRRSCNPSAPLSRYRRSATAARRRRFPYKTCSRPAVRPGSGRGRPWVLGLGRPSLLRYSDLPSPFRAQSVFAFGAQLP